MKLYAVLLASAAFITPAMAADVVYEEPAPMEAVADSWNWSGLYVGVFGGVATADFDYREHYEITGLGELSGSLEVSGGGMLGGVQVGYDFQAGNVVFGVVADIALTNIDAEIEQSIDDFASVEISSELQYLGTVRGRIGYAMDRFMVYGHGGFAYGETEQNLAVRDALGNDVFGFTLDDGDTKMGYTIGAGFEYAITNNVSFQTEYAFTDLGKDVIYHGEVFGGDNFKVTEDLSFHTIKAAINFRF